MCRVSGSRWFRKIDRRWLAAIPAVIPALIVALVYLPALRNGLVWDDVTFLSDLPLYRDPSLAARIGDGAREAIVNFTWDALCARMEQAFQRHLGE